ncbi:ABC transporter substrate-binding protein [Cohnella thailandensis]|uniref:Extracellular solute-binding protein n=1 Tax=Cohnella thailandensis TaxID=557557 RepID=A0A841SYT5_9BACL|nr:extracellular solute-binding protein [Cohnella thailandensis]MBB6635786.1 extracellular solute-binding protein [Cohnella thailandensis]MBP1976164.1 multiple sugar transport system substrate-binding protein [Cohnella thailandensis]
MKRSAGCALWLGVMLSAATLVGACSNDEAEPIVPEEEKQTVIRFVAAEYSTESKPFLEKLVREFEMRNPEIIVDLQVANWNVLDGIYTSMLSKNQPPDLLITNVYAHFAKAGKLNDLNGIISPELKGKLYPNLMQMDRIGDKQYALPYVSSIRNLYYNEALFEGAGIEEPPKTWSELMEDARRIKETSTAHGFGVDLTDDEIQAYLSYFFFGSGGGWIKNGKWTINSPENVRGLTYLKELYDQGLTDSEPTVTTRDEKQRIMGDGKLGMMISGNYFASVVPRESPGLAWGSGPIPVRDGTQPISFGVQDVLVSFQTDHTDRAALSKFLDFLYEDKNYEDMVTREGFIPVTSTVGGKLSRSDPTMRRYLEELGTAKFYPIQEPAWQAVMDTSRKMGDAVLYDNLSPREALDQLQKFAETRSGR